MNYLVQVVNLQDTANNYDYGEEPCLEEFKLVISLKSQLQGNTHSFDTHDLHMQKQCHARSMSG